MRHPIVIFCFFIIVVVVGSLKCGNVTTTETCEPDELCAMNITTEDFKREGRQETPPFTCQHKDYKSCNFNMNQCYTSTATNMTTCCCTDNTNANACPPTHVIPNSVTTTSTTSTSTTTTTTSTTTTITTTVAPTTGMTHPITGAHDTTSTINQQTLVPTKATIKRSVNTTENVIPTTLITSIETTQFVTTTAASENETNVMTIAVVALVLSVISIVLVLALVGYIWLKLKHPKDNTKSDWGILPAATDRTESRIAQVNKTGMNSNVDLKTAKPNSVAPLTRTVTPKLSPVVSVMPLPPTLHAHAALVPALTIAPLPATAVNNVTTAMPGKTPANNLATAMPGKPPSAPTNLKTAMPGKAPAAVPGKPMESNKPTTPKKQEYLKKPAANPPNQ